LRRLNRVAALGIVLLHFPTVSLRAQEAEGADWARFVGGALGLYSGAILGTAGGLLPCSQTAAGPRCVRLTAFAGGSIGLVGGVYLGDASADDVETALKGAGYGLLIGSATGVLLKELVYTYDWLDVATVGAIGTAVGASARGVAIGLAAGGLVGTVLWFVLPSFDPADAVGLGIAGMAIGGVADWVFRGVEARESETASAWFVLPVTIRF
jgi:hypothetical protein